MDVKQRIRVIIDSRPDLTIRGVSLASGMSDSALHKFLTNQTQSMTIDNLERIAEAMGISLRVLLFDEEADIVQIWDRIPIERRQHASDVLATFADREHF